MAERRNNWTIKHGEAKVRFGLFILYIYLFIYLFIMICSFQQFKKQILTLLVIFINSSPMIYKIQFCRKTYKRVLQWTFKKNISAFLLRFFILFSSSVCFFFIPFLVYFFVIFFLLRLCFSFFPSQIVHSPLPYNTFVNQRIIDP